MIERVEKEELERDERNSDTELQRRIDIEKDIKVKICIGILRRSTKKRGAEDATERNRKRK